MNLSNSVLFKAMLAPMQMNRFHNVKLHVFKSSGKPTYNSDNEIIYHSKFAWYAERSSLAEISPKSMSVPPGQTVFQILHLFSETE